jgi:hypothetical protein
MINVEPDGKGSTKATTETVNGTTDGKLVVSLTTGSFLGTTGLTFSGRRSGDQITLTYADKTGQLQAAVYGAAAQATFNASLTSWQTQLAQAKADADQAAADKKATDARNNALAQAVIDRSRGLQDMISLLAGGTRNRINGVAQAASDLQGAQGVLGSLRTHLALVRTDATEPLSQYQACNVVRYDFVNTMGYDFNNSLSYDRNNFAAEAATLATNLTAIEQRVAETKQAAAALGYAIAASPLRVTGVLSPGDEQTTIDTYRATATAVAKQLVDLRATDASIYATAQDLMAQGQSIWNTVKANHRCS